MKRTLSLLSVIAMVMVLIYACKKTEAPETAAGSAKNKMSTLSLTKESSTPTSITLRVTAGVSGAPAGFSVQWMTKATFDANGGKWPSVEDGLCKASFSGNAFDSRYNLPSNGSVTVEIGEILFDNGASTNCDGDLVCNTEYVFRAFAHATNTIMRSEFSSNLFASTSPCGDCSTHGMGYWRNHGPVPTGNNTYDWPQSVKDNGMTLGTVSYTPEQILSILKTAPGGNGLVLLAHQLISAKMNVAALGGTAPQSVLDGIAAADALIGSLVVPPVGNGSLTSQQVTSLFNDLKGFNQGQNCGRN